MVLTPETEAWVRKHYAPSESSTRQKNMPQEYSRSSGISVAITHNPCYQENVILRRELEEKYERFGMNNSRFYRKRVIDVDIGENPSVLDQYCFDGRVGDICGGMLGVILEYFQRENKLEKVREYLVAMLEYFDLLLNYEDFAQAELNSSGFTSDEILLTDVYSQLLRQAGVLGKQNDTNYKLEYIGLLKKHFTEKEQTKQKIQDIQESTRCQIVPFLQRAVNE